MTKIKHAFDGRTTPEPLFVSWADYLNRASYPLRMNRCNQAAKKANLRFPSRLGHSRLIGRQVWEVIERAQGRCCYCGSLAVEGKPDRRTTNGRGIWGHVGRRIGSLEHLSVTILPDHNVAENLAWACLWCNVHPDQRIWQTPDHGGIYSGATYQSHTSPRTI